MPLDHNDWTQYREFSEAARRHDAQDDLAAFRDRFHMPPHGDGDTLYFTGNSLGLQPVGARDIIDGELEDWQRFGVEAHFEGRRPWVTYHREATADLAAIVGAQPEEVVAMNALTVNLHLLLVSFYRPEGQRTKLMIEAGAFPSDRYAALSQLRLHGLDPDEHLIEIAPRDGEHTLRTEDITARIAEEGSQLACVMLCGVQYYTGQWMPMREITEAAHAVGATCGFDLAHAAGNVPLQLHDWGVDFACWCGYKYLNGGPGCTAGAFVHARHAMKPELNRLEGWWGHAESRRFKMEPDFDLMPGAEGWQTSNAPVMNMAALLASLAEFRAAGMDRLRQKSLKLTAFLEEGIHAVAHSTGSSLEILTPSDPSARGCQLSVVAHGHGKALFDHLTQNGVIVDWREPAVIRLAPVPMYNSFSDVAEFLNVLHSGLRRDA
ncbi:MAG: kynureninase [Flavobacteriales bacterium]|nr:kynureninase [Flavobacteriales bacterium]